MPGSEDATGPILKPVKSQFNALLWSDADRVNDSRTVDPVICITIWPPGACLFDSARGKQRNV